MVAPGESPPLEGGNALRIGLASNREAPTLARAAIVGFFGDSGLTAARLETLTLLVSELMSNAVLHADAPSSSEILLCARWLSRDAVRVEVVDQGSGFTARPHDRAPHGGGYGLYIVDRQATRWGVDRVGGTRVWFELAREPPDTRG
jgi:anti-sigma regulatory factor (Ser/Thr protein kinase)